MCACMLTSLPSLLSYVIFCPIWGMVYCMQTWVSEVPLISPHPPFALWHSHDSRQEEESIEFGLDAWLTLTKTVKWEWQCARSEPRLHEALYTWTCSFELCPPSCKRAQLACGQPTATNNYQTCEWVKAQSHVLFSSSGTLTDWSLERNANKSQERPAKNWAIHLSPTCWPRESWVNKIAAVLTH